MRQVVERVEVDAQGKSEQVRVRMIWVGGGQTEGLVVRPIARSADRSDYARLCARVRELTLAGWNAPAIAHQLDADGYPSVRSGRRWSAQSVLALRRHAGLGGQPHRGQSREALGPDEWWAPELARALPVPRSCLFSWIQRGQVRARQVDRGLHRWIVLADAAEMERLRQYHRRDRAAETRQQWTATLRTEPTRS